MQLPRSRPLYEQDLQLKEANIVLYIKKFLCGNIGWADLRAGIRHTLEQGGTHHERETV